MQFRGIQDVRTLPETQPAYLVSVEIEVDAEWLRVEYAARAGGGGISDAVLAEIALGNLAGEITTYAPSAPPPAMDTALTQAQWHYGLRRFGLLAAIEAFVADLESTDAIAAYQFEARSLRANKFIYADVLALIATYAQVLPEPLQLSENDIAGMWSTVLAEMPA